MLGAPSIPGFCRMKIFQYKCSGCIWNFDNLAVSQLPKCFFIIT